MLDIGFFNIAQRRALYEKVNFHTGTFGFCVELRDAATGVCTDLERYGPHAGARDHGISECDFYTRTP